MRYVFSRLVWGLLILFIAAFVLLNQFYNFSDIGIGRIIISVIAAAFIIMCIADLHFTILPIPLAVLYLIYQPYLDLPAVQPWTLILASILASIGLSIIFPWRNWHNRYYNKKFRRAGDQKSQMLTEDCAEDDNPSVSLNFGAISRRLHSNNLKTARLNCNFGAMEIFFNQTTLNPEGAEIYVNCSFGAVVLFIPKEWRVIDKLNFSLGGMDIDKNFLNSQENAPKLTLSGSVSFGGIEVKEI